MKISSFALLSLAAAIVPIVSSAQDSTRTRKLSTKSGKKSSGDYKKILIRNLSQAQIMSPMFFASHSCDIHLFEMEEPASDALAVLAENGDPSDLMYYFESMNACEVGSTGPTPPGNAVEFVVPTSYGCECVSAASMFISTNDAFVGLNSEWIGDDTWGFFGTRPAYDAGSEENDELCTNIPGPPCNSTSGNDNTGTPEGFVHVSRGISGFYDIPIAYDWRNPSISISVMPYYH